MSDAKQDQEPALSVPITALDLSHGVTGQPRNAISVEGCMGLSVAQAPEPTACGRGGADGATPSC